MADRMNPETAAREALVTDAMVEAAHNAAFAVFKAFAAEKGWPHPETRQELPEPVRQCCDLETRAALTAALSARTDAEAWQPTHRHVKRGSTYRVVGEAEGQVSTGDYRKGQRDAEDIAARLASDGDKIVVYQEEDGKLWWRFADEFSDGRFEALRSTTQTETEADDGR